MFSESRKKTSNFNGGGFKARKKWEKGGNTRGGSPYDWWENANRNPPTVTGGKWEGKNEGKSTTIVGTK